MFQKKTTIVIGAGASNEVDLPVGRELKKLISKTLDFKFDGFQQKSGSYNTFNAIKKYILDSGLNLSVLNDYLDAAHTIYNGMPQAISIDNYIDAHRDNNKIELCGKLAIAESILAAERSSKLFVDNSNIYNSINFNKIEGTWFNSFLQLLTENCSIHELEQRLESITMIIYNYDRCVEHYLYHSLQNYYKIDKDKAKQLVLGIKIYHPYGSLGELPWMNNKGIDFGAPDNVTNLLKISNTIKTFTESQDPESSEINNIRKAAANAEILIFLGFHYHKQNLRLLKPNRDDIQNMPKTQCFGTSIGISASDTKRIKNELSNFANISADNIYLENMKCSELFHEHWRSLSWD